MKCLITAVHDIDKGQTGYKYLAHAFYNNLVFTLIFYYYVFHNLKKNVARVDVTPYISVSTCKLFYEKKYIYVQKIHTFL
jgi:hypothetical protein